jgi:hyperosmotically inducible periplasmic protein
MFWGGNMSIAWVRLETALLISLVLAACSTTPKAPDVTGAIRDSLKQEGLTNVSVTQDRDKGVVTLQGNVAAAGDKVRAESVARSVAAGQVVANEIAILPVGATGVAKTINADLDAGIKKNLDAELLAHAPLHDQVNYAVKNGVVTLTGAVNSETARTEVQQIAARVPNVEQVVNELQVKNQKATSTH